MAEYNSQAFTPEECEKGLHLDLIKFLLEQSNKFENSYYDIHIDNDGYCTIVEWYDKSFEYDDNEGFRFVDYEHELMYRLDFPDNHYEYFYNKEEAEEALQLWLKDNPGWKKNQFGRWYNEIEEEKPRKELLDNKCNKIVDIKGIAYDGTVDLSKEFLDDYEIVQDKDDKND